MDLRKQLIDFEGFRNAAYPDPLTGGAPWTIGVGHAGPEVFKGLVWSDDMVHATLTHDIAQKTAQCVKNFPWFSGLNEPRQAVLVGMCFQLGITGLLAFKRSLGAMRDERFADAAEAMRQSTWAKQTPRRVARLAYQMEAGEWK